MMTTMVHIAALFALAGALAGDRTAWALLVNVGVCLALIRAEVVFDLELWVLIDVLVALAIVTPAMVQEPNAHRRDWAVIGLFGVAFFFYLCPDPWRHIGSASVSTVQLLLTFPAGKIHARIAAFIARVRASARPFDDMMRALFPVRLREAI